MQHYLNPAHGFNPRIREDATGHVFGRVFAHAVSIHASVRMRRPEAYGLSIKRVTRVLRQPVSKAGYCQAQSWVIFCQYAFPNSLQEAPISREFPVSLGLAQGGIRHSNFPGHPPLSRVPSGLHPTYSLMLAVPPRCVQQHLHRSPNDAAPYDSGKTGACEKTPFREDRHSLIDANRPGPVLPLPCKRSRPYGRLQSIGE